MPTALSRMRLIAFAHSSAGMTEEDWGTVTRHQHLAQADRLIADCLDRIARQREVITTEYEQGLPTDIAESMPRALEESLPSCGWRRRRLARWIGSAQPFSRLLHSL
jgi:hypothetical protein